MAPSSVDQGQEDGPPAGSDVPDRLCGRVLGGAYRLVRRLGQGGAGAVYLAEQLPLQRRVVVKLLHDDERGNPLTVERFRREALLLSRIDHPNVVGVIDFGQAEDGTLYLVLQHVEGESLAARLGRGPLAQQLALGLIDQVLAALVAVHAQGIVHRDLKPENVMLSHGLDGEPRVRVVDFGIARALHSGGRTPWDSSQEGLGSGSGTVVGTPRYLSPEQAQGLPVDGRADLFALGILMHELLTGAHPWPAAGPLEAMRRHVEDPLAPPGTAFPQCGIHPSVEQVVLRALDKQPERRFADAAQMQQALRAAWCELAGGVSPRRAPLDCGPPDALAGQAPAGLRLSESTGGLAPPEVLAALRAGASAADLLALAPRPLTTTGSSVATDLEPAVPADDDLTGGQALAAGAGSDAALAAAAGPGRRGRVWLGLGQGLILGLLGAAAAGAWLGPGDWWSPPTRLPHLAGGTMNASPLGPARRLHDERLLAGWTTRPLGDGGLQLVEGIDPRRFDPTAFAPRAAALARRLHADAELVQLEASGLTEEAAGKLGVGYLFRSPARSAAAPAGAGGSLRPAGCLVRVQVSGRTVVALPEASAACREPLAPLPRCTLSALRRRLGGSGDAAPDLSRLTYAAAPPGRGRWRIVRANDAEPLTVADDCDR